MRLTGEKARARTHWESIGICLEVSTPRENPLSRRLYVLCAPVQGVHKVSLQFQKFITKAIDETATSGLFHVLGGYQGFYHIASQVACW